MRVGEAMGEELRSLGVEVVFGIPGVHTIELYRGLERAGIRAVTPRHEQGAGFMADAYARVSGRPGVCVLITGPGVTNAMTPIAQAFHDSVPLLVVASTTERALLGAGRGPLHDVPDQALLVASVTGFSETVGDPAAAADALRRAWRSLHGGRPRPAHLAVPVDVLGLEVDGSPDSPAPTASEVAEPPPDALERAAALLAEAERPALLLGGGAVDAGPQAAALAERLGAPVAVTGNAKGVLPSSHPLCLGATLPFAAVQALVCGADVAVLAGTELSEVDWLYTGTPPRFAGRVIRIDVDPAQLQRGATADVALHGDAGRTLERLGDALPPARTPAADAAARVKSALADLEWTESSRSHLPWLDAIDAALPDDRIVALDSTQPAYTAHHYLGAERPRSWLAPYGLGTLGPALPMAIGAKLAAPERPVLALAGDGGLLFTIAELATAVDLGLSLPVVVWDNRGYGEIRDAFGRAGAPAIGTETTARDLPAIAAGFGCATAAPATPAELTAAIGVALETDRPTLIRVEAP